MTLHQRIKLIMVHQKKTSASPPPPTNGIQIEKCVLDAILHPPKITLQKYGLNPNACVT